MSVLNLSLWQAGVGRRLQDGWTCFAFLRPGSQNKDVCGTGIQGWVPQDVTEDSRVWKGGASEDTETEVAGGPSRGQGIDLCGHSLRIEAGEKKNWSQGLYPEEPGMTGKGADNSLARKLCSKARQAKDQRGQGPKISWTWWLDSYQRSIQLFKFHIWIFFFTDDSDNNIQTSGHKGAIFSGKKLDIAPLIYFWLHKWHFTIETSHSTSSTEWIFSNWWLTPRILKKQTPIKVSKESFWGPAMGRFRSKGWFWDAEEDF